MLLGLVALLLVLAAAYVEAVSSRAVLAVVVLGPALVAAVSPLAGVTLALAGAPLVDVVASAITARVAAPELLPIAWVEPFWLGTGAGLLLALLRRRPSTPLPAAFALAMWTLGGIAAIALGGLALEWRAHLPALARVAWRSLPWFDGATADHVFRASLLLVAGPAWAWLVARSLRDGRDARWVWGGWLVTSTVTAAYGTWMWWAGATRRLPRVGPVPDDINSYASYLVLAVFIALALLAGAERPVARALLAGAGAAAAWMLLPTGSHTAVLAVLAGMCALVFWPTFSWRRLAAALAVAAILGAGVGALALTERSRHVLEVASESVDPRFLRTYFRDGRQAIWSASGRVVLAHPVLGLGPGALYRRLGEFYREGDVGWRPAQENAHNYLLQLAAEAGVPGAAAFLVAVVAAVWAALRGRTSEPVRGRILAVGVLAYLVTCVGGHSLLLARQMLLFWGLVGTVLALTPASGVPFATRRPGFSPTTRHGLAVVAALVVLAVLLRPGHRACPGMASDAGLVRIDFGVGFDAPVTVPSGRWRWLEDGGQIRFCNGSAAPLAADVTFTAVAFEAARRLDVHGLGPRPQRIHVPPHPASLRLAVAVPPGSSSLILVPRPGAWRIGAVKQNGDPRVVSVLLDDPAITIR